MLFVSPIQPGVVFTTIGWARTRRAQRWRTNCAKDHMLPPNFPDLFLSPSSKGQPSEHICFNCRSIPHDHPQGDCCFGIVHLNFGEPSAAVSCPDINASPVATGHQENRPILWTRFVQGRPTCYDGQPIETPGHGKMLRAHS